MEKAPQEQSVEMADDHIDLGVLHDEHDDYNDIENDSNEDDDGGDGRRLVYMCGKVSIHVKATVTK